MKPTRRGSCSAAWQIVSAVLLAAALLCPLSCSDPQQKKVFVIAIDGMDYQKVREWMAEGRLPNLEALEKEGGFRSLGTSIPPESPVAWSNFFTGLNPGGHGVFDFMHPSWEKDEETGEQYLSLVDSIADTEDVGFILPLFGYEFPLSGGDWINKQLGRPFWEILEDHDVPATLYKVPACFPPRPTDQKIVTGMGTPDLPGTGEYTLYTNDRFAVSANIERGRLENVAIFDSRIDAFLYGPENIFVKTGEHESKPVARSPFRIYMDPEEPLIKIIVGDEDDDSAPVVILKEGEWSDFVPVTFEFVPFLVSATGITRFCLEEIRPPTHPDGPFIKLFADPINVDPASPVYDISTPSGWVGELAEEHGLFETKGLPENYTALKEGAIDYKDFRSHSCAIHEKRKEMLFDLMENHESGFLFFYFCSIDLDSHMCWRCMDEKHPGHDPETMAEYKHFIRSLYEDIDGVVGELRSRIGDEDTLIIMSDHGFSPYYKSFHLNSWLVENGYAALKEECDRESDTFFASVDWSRTRAYNLGFANIYLNVKGRDPLGIVDPGEADGLINEICSKLMAERDGDKDIFLRMYRTREHYSGEALSRAPEIVVGFNRKYRNSDESSIGGYPDKVLEDNLGAWSGCHLMACELVPGILFSNKKILKKDPDLTDLTVTILNEYGIDRLPEMKGKSIW